MRFYDQRDVEFLRLQQKPTKVKGSPVIIKNSPTEPRGGYLDHHEHAIIKEHWVARSRDASAPAKKMTKKQQLEAMRDGMGFPNRNLCTKEIHTKFETIKVGGNKVGLWRYYTREGKNNKNRPCFIFLHGGGWVGGTPYTVENPCRLIAELADAVVFNVDYALAPEKKYPHAFNDCYGVLQHIHQHAKEYGIDPNRIAMGGDSAGGNLTAAVAMKDRDEGGKMLALQVLMYACVVLKTTGIPGYEWKDSEFEMSKEQESLLDACLGIGRPVKGVTSINSMYLSDPDKQMDDPYVSPMLADDFKGLAPMLSVACEYDGLRIQDEHYARLLEKAGVPVKSIRYRGVTHAFIDRLGFVPQAEDLCIEIAEAIKKM